MATIHISGKVKSHVLVCSVGYEFQKAWWIPHPGVRRRVRLKYHRPIQ